MKRKARWWQWAAIVGGLLFGVLPTALVLPWRWLDPPTSAFISRAKSEGFAVQQEWVDWPEISPYLPIAVVAAEDQRFPYHSGFDIESIRSALGERQQRQRGASTISQQVAKNLFLWPGHSWLRKGLEAYLTVFVEMLWPKRRILEVYLNVAEFGPGIFGVEAAATAFFGRHAKNVTLRQAATLAAVLPSPKRMSPAEPSRHVRQRVTWILRQVEQLGGPAYLEAI